jgi:sulfatase maturation enzyme AslB (radical SAM superfamily)
LIIEEERLLCLRELLTVNNLITLARKAVRVLKTRGVRSLFIVTLNYLGEYEFRMKKDRADRLRQQEQSATAARVRAMLGGVMQLEPTNYCNIKCPYCPNQGLEHKGTLDLNVLRHVIKHLRLSNGEMATPSITLCGYGEPFLNDQTYRIIDMLADAGLEVHIQSNGKWKVDEHRFATLARVATICITIDGVTNATFNKSRPDTDVNAIFDNIRHVIELRRELNSNTPHISVRMNVFPFNYHEGGALVERCYALGVDVVYLKCGYGAGNAPPIPDFNPSQYPPSFLFIDSELSITNPARQEVMA